MEIKGTCVSKNFDETVCHQSEKKKDCIRERLEESAISALRLASRDVEVVIFQPLPITKNDRLQFFF